ncbi:MAG: nucleoside monophosphate kinase [Patescibacteria group bacterium]
MHARGGKQAVVIYGPPGSGKGTQAELLARRYGFTHFDTGHYIDSVVHAPGASKDPVLRRERMAYDAGRLCTPSWVFRIVSDAVRRIARAGGSVAFSGSPRTVPEAFGPDYVSSGGRSQKIHGMYLLLEKLYGERNVHIVTLHIPDSASFKRNSRRFICSVCGLPVLASSRSRFCSFCEAPVRRRRDDSPKIIKDRLAEYRKRTYPILATLRKFGYRVHAVDGTPAPWKVHRNVARTLKLS